MGRVGRRDSSEWVETSKGKKDGWNDHPRPESPILNGSRSGGTRGTWDGPETTKGGVPHTKTVGRQEDEVPDGV